MPGTEQIFYSIDQVNDNDARAIVEIINNLNPQGMPLHKLGAIYADKKLKSSRGYLQWDKVVVTNMARHVIEAVIPDGLLKGKILYIPRFFNKPPRNSIPY